MKKYFVMLCLVMLFMTAMCLCVSAANVCKDIGGSLNETVEFTFKTGNKLFTSEKVVFKQNKGETIQIGYYDGGKTTNASKYGKYYITVYNETDKKYVYKDKAWKDGQFTILSGKLHNNKTYKVTIRGVTYEEGFSLIYSDLRHSFKGWKTYPNWYVSKTGGNIKICY